MLTKLLGGERRKTAGLCELSLSKSSYERVQPLSPPLPMTSSWLPSTHLIYNPCSTCMFWGRKWNTGIRFYGFGCLPTEFTKVLLFTLRRRKKKRFPLPLLPSTPLPTFSESHWFVCLFVFRDVLENGQWSGHSWGLSFHRLFSTALSSATPNASPVGNTFYWKNCGCGNGGEDFSTSEMKEMVHLCWFKLSYCAVCWIAPAARCLRL